jgi:D-aminoacyl-tRNA deacylase
MILLMASNKDIASQNIKQQILENYPFTQVPEMYQQSILHTLDIGGEIVTLATLNHESVTAQCLEEDFPNAKLIVFISRHSSQSGKPTLTVHTPGNIGIAKSGGLSKQVSICPALVMQTALKMLLHYKEALKINYDVSYECTHHGPSLKIPAMFVELGSSLYQWRDITAAQAVAHAAIYAISNVTVSSAPVALGIGGTHYNQKFTQMALMGEAIFGHIIPKYAISYVDTEILSMCIERTLEKVTVAVLDWKGIRSVDKPRLIEALDSVGLPYKKV